MAEGDFALWSTVDTAAAIGTASGPRTFELEQVRDPSFSLASSSRVTVSEDGRYLVRWDCAARRNPAAASPTRALLYGRLRKNGTTFLSIGHAAGYWRAAESCDECGLCSGAILDLLAGDYVELLVQRVDTSGTAGNTLQGSTSNLVASIGIWRLRDSWELVDLEVDADQTPSTPDFSQPPLFKVLAAEGGWAGTGAIGDPVSAGDYTVTGGEGDPIPNILFLVCCSFEADSSSTTLQGLLELLVELGTGAIHTTFSERARVTSYTEGPAGCTKAVATWVGLLDAFQGEFGTVSVAVEYLHRNSNGVNFTPRANKVRLQAVAIPKADVDYVMARQQPGGQNASITQAVAFDTTTHEGDSWDHNPGDLDPTKVQAVGDGQWAMVFAGAYAHPVGGDRNAQRLSHQLELRVQGAGLTYAGAVSMDRGSSAGCDRSGLSVNGIARVGAAEELELYHEQKASG